MIRRMTIDLPEDLLRQAKCKATAEGRTLSSLIEEGLRLVIGQSSNKRRTERVLPRVSKAQGGPMPGIDYTDVSALQELDDLEYVERMKRFA
jgi:hypothetical protein